MPGIFVSYQFWPATETFLEELIAGLWDKLVVHVRRGLRFDNEVSDVGRVVIAEVLLWRLQDLLIVDGPWVVFDEVFKVILYASIARLNQF